MQTASPGTYKNVFDCMVKTYREGGIRTLFNGATPAMTTAVIENTLVFGANETLKRFIMSHQSDPNEPLPISTVALIGAAAGFFQGIFACPAEVVKCRLQVFSQGSGQVAGNGPVYTGPVDCGRKIFAESGLKGLYKGFSAFVAREVPFYLLFFASYEFYCKTMCTRRECTRGELTPTEILLAGGAAGCTAWTAVVPADTVKSQMQTSRENHSALATAKRILKTEGLFRGLFRGWTPIMIR